MRAAHAVVETLECRQLLSGTLPSSVHASSDAQYTVAATGTAGSPAWNVDLSAGTFSFDADLGATDWQSLSLTVSGSVTLALNTHQTFSSLTLLDSAHVIATSSGGGANGNFLLIGPGGLSIPADPNTGLFTPTLDLMDNDMILQGAGTTGFAQVTALLTSGYQHGWAGTGITSSDAAATSGISVGKTDLGFGLNYAANTGIHFSSLDGVGGLGSSDVLIRYTLAGDSNLSLNVTNVDYVYLSNNFNQSGTTWATGDYTFDGNTHNNDFTILSNNFGLGLTGPQAPRDILPAGAPINAVEGQRFSGTLATFTDLLNTPGNPNPTTSSSYQASVSWGDGNFVPATVADDGYGDGGFAVTATSPNPLANPDALITTLIQYSPSSGLSGRQGSLGEPLLAILPAVTQLYASPASTSEIDLRWTLNATNASAIEVDRSSDDVGFSALTTTLSGTATAYQDTSAAIGQHYYYEVRAIQPGGPSAFTPTTDTYAVSAVSDLTATAASTSEIDLLWASNTSDATMFEIDRSTDGVAFSPVATSFDSTYNDTGLNEGMHYWYQVKAYELVGVSAPCIAQDIYTLPNAPTLNSVTAAAGDTVLGGTGADLHWTDNSTHSPGFVVERSDDGSFWEEADSTDPGVTTDFDQGVADGTTYYYRVRAQTPDGGESDPSAANVFQVFIPLTPPTLLTAAVVSSSQINLSWENDSLSATQLSVQRSTDGGQTYSEIKRLADPNASTYSDTGLSAGTPYYYQIVAMTSALSSHPSWFASGTTPT